MFTVYLYVAAQGGLAAISNLEVSAYWGLYTPDSWEIIC